MKAPSYMVDHQLRGLKPARQRLDVPAAELAEAIGYTLNSYYRVENGTRRLYFDAACRLADHLGISVEELRRDPGAPPAGTVEAGAALAGWVE